MKKSGVSLGKRFQLISFPQCQRRFLKSAGTPLVEIGGKLDLAGRFGIIEMVLDGVCCQRTRSVGFDFRGNGKRVRGQVIEAIERNGERTGVLIMRSRNVLQKLGEQSIL